MLLDHGDKLGKLCDTFQMARTLINWAPDDLTFKQLIGCSFIIQKNVTKHMAIGVFFSFCFSKGHWVGESTSI